MKKVFIDGSAGTTGLRIAERLKSRTDISLIEVDEACRKDDGYRKALLNEADIAFLCLPDEAARQAVSMIEKPDTVVIDTSTAHRVADGWVYGFAELGCRREEIKSAKRIANPGCHASGFLSLAAPLVECGVLSPAAQLSCFSLTGYSGGGKKMIAQYEADERDVLLDAPRLYGLSQTHKHLPEMQAVAKLETPPVFCPIVAPFYAGMEVVISLFGADKNKICDVYRSYYREGLVHYIENADEEGFLSAGAMTGRDDMQITVCGNEERLLLISRFDNLGKGASGAAIQNMNLVLGVSETTGLTV